MKYVPVCFLLIFIVFGGTFVPLIIYCILGFYQHMIRKKSLTCFPLKVYRKFDALMPDALKNRNGYVLVSKVEENLTKVCKNEGCCNWSSNEDTNELREN